MVNLVQNPILFGDGLWLYDQDKEIPSYTLNKRKRKLVRKTIQNILLLFKA
ncbi:MAG: hypothetical protein GX300_10255 [Tissierellia bacterium]|nr:hypothetical protein [Tissierellia bacterium]